MILNIALALSMLGSVEEEQRYCDLIEHYKKLMFYIARKYVSDVEEQKDVVQESLVALARNFYKISDITSHETKAYVVTVVESKAINQYHKNKRQLPTEPLEEVQGLAVEYQGENRVTQCILKLPARDREFMLLKYVNGLNNKELAEIFQISVAGVRKLEQRAKVKLEVLCREEGLL